MPGRKRLLQLIVDLVGQLSEQAAGGKLHLATRPIGQNIGQVARLRSRRNFGPVHVVWIIGADGNRGPGFGLEIFGDRLKFRHMTSSRSTW